MADIMPPESQERVADDDLMIERRDEEAFNTFYLRRRRELRLR